MLRSCPALAVGGGGIVTGGNQFHFFDIFCGMDGISLRLVLHIVESVGDICRESYH